MKKSNIDKQSKIQRLIRMLTVKIKKNKQALMNKKTGERTSDGSLNLICDRDIIISSGLINVMAGAIRVRCPPQELWAVRLRI